VIERLGVWVRVSHISPKTGEIWGTHYVVALGTSPETFADRVSDRAVPADVNLQLSICRFP
jgi:hypothetical protein